MQIQRKSSLGFPRENRAPAHGTVAPGGPGVQYLPLTPVGGDAMAGVFITGFSTGLGLIAAQLLLELGHRVVVHGRNPERADATLASVPGADAAVVGDLSSIRGMRSVADQVNALGRFDAVIHNAGIGYRESRRVETEDGLPQLFATNTLAPYVLTALIHKPKRLVYLSSGMHRGANLNLDDLTWVKRPWRGAEAYAETKLHDVLIAFGVARRWPDVLSNALEPGWVATRMGALALRMIWTGTERDLRLAVAMTSCDGQCVLPAASEANPASQREGLRSILELPSPIRASCSLADDVTQRPVSWRCFFTAYAPTASSPQRWIIAGIDWLRETISHRRSRTG